MTDNKIKTLGQRITAVRAELGGIQKSKYNTFEKYYYSDLNDINLKLKPALDKHGVNIYPLREDPINDAYIEFSATGKTYTYTAMMTIEIVNADDAQDKITLTTPIFGTNKSPEKAHGTALTYGFKYLFKNFFNINDGEDDADAMDANPQLANKPKARMAQQKQAQDGVKYQNGVNSQSGVTEAQIKRLYAIGKQKGFDSDKIHESIHKLIGAKHTAEMTIEEYHTLINALEKKT